MSLLTLAAALMVLADSSPVKTCLDSQTDAAAAYGSCVVDKARQFEASGESADNIAIAAVSACVDARKTVEDGIQACSDYEFAASTVAKLDVAVHDAAIETVVTVRARRNSSQR